MQGKPYAGNPHVRFDEGAGAPRHSGRSALLYNIEFKCPQCRNAVSVDGSYRGQVVECPHCGKGIVIPRGAPVKTSQNMQSGQTLRHGKRISPSVDRNSHIPGISGREPLSRSHSSVSLRSAGQNDSPPIIPLPSEGECHGSYISYWFAKFLLCVLFGSIVGFAAGYLNSYCGLWPFRRFDITFVSSSKPIFLNGMFYLGLVLVLCGLVLMVAALFRRLEMGFREWVLFCTLLTWLQHRGEKKLSSYGGNVK